MTDLTITGDFHAERLSYLENTDVTAVLGLHPYKTAFEVWLEKTGQKPPFEGNDRTEMGTGLEPYIAGKFEKEFGVTLEKGKFIRHPVFHHFGGHPDYFFTSSFGSVEGVECKLVGLRAMTRWSEPGPDQKVPEEYYVQCQWYMFLTGLSVWYLVAQKEFQKKLAIYVIDVDGDFIKRAADACDLWWHSHIEEGLPPDNATEGFLAKMYPKPATTSLVSASKEDALTLSLYKDVEYEREKINAEYESLRNKIRGIIGDNLGVKGNGFVATWSPVKDSTTKVVDFRKFLKVRFSYVPTDEELLEYTAEVVTRKGTRKLDVKWTK